MTEPTDNPAIWCPTCGASCSVCSPSVDDLAGILKAAQPTENPRSGWSTDIMSHDLRALHVDTQLTREDVHTLRAAADRLDALYYGDEVASLRAQLAAMKNTDAMQMWEDREGWKRTAADRGFELDALRSRLAEAEAENDDISAALDTANCPAVDDDGDALPSEERILWLAEAIEERMSAILHLEDQLDEARSRLSSFEAGVKAIPQWVYGVGGEMIRAHKSDNWKRYVELSDVLAALSQPATPPTP